MSFIGPGLRVADPTFRRAGGVVQNPVFQELVA